MMHVSLVEAPFLEAWVVGYGPVVGTVKSGVVTGAPPPLTSSDEAG